MGQLIRACPVCGTRVEHHCHHNGGEIRPVMMPKERALHKLTEAIGDLQGALNELIRERDAVKELMQCPSCNGAGGEWFDTCNVCGGSGVDPDEVGKAD